MRRPSRERRGGRYTQKTIKSAGRGVSREQGCAHQGTHHLLDILDSWLDLVLGQVVTVEVTVAVATMVVAMMVVATAVVIVGVEAIVVETVAAAASFDKPRKYLVVGFGTAVMMVSWRDRCGLPRIPLVSL